MTQVINELQARFAGWHGTAAELAARAGRERSDSSVKRALAKGVEDGVIARTEVAHGPRTGEVVFHPPHVASGYGGAVVHGIEKGQARTAAFERFQARLGYGTIGKGDPEIVRRYNQAHGFQEAADHVLATIPRKA